MNDTHMLGIYITFGFMIFLAILPYVVIKYVKKQGRISDKDKKGQTTS